VVLLARQLAMRSVVEMVRLLVEPWVERLELR